MDDTNYVRDKLIHGEAFFFAGSGICYESNLPSARTILKHSANVFLPTSVSEQEKDDTCTRIQPEVFYESIIGMTQKYDCLDMWRSLYKPEQEKHGLKCEPNLAHLFIAKYSQKYNVPIITTNFDCLFEQACDTLGIEYRVLLPDDSPPDIDSNVDTLSICKVHGSIQNMEGEYSPYTLWTTMTQITKVNTKWIEYLNALMQKKHMCFVGYSGKDIDIFPYIHEFSKEMEVKNILWINRFDRGHSDVASKACGATRACLRPTELFKDIAHELGLQPAQNNQTTNEPVAVENFLYFLEKSLANKRLLTDDEKELFHAVLQAKLGHYSAAHKHVTEIESRKSLQFSKHSNRHLLVLSCARLSHEISRYESCERYARQALTMLKSKDPYEINAFIQASCLVSEANRMSTPYDMYFRQPKTISDYLHGLFVVTHFILTMFTSKTRMLYLKQSAAKLEIETHHEMILHRIRFWALIQAVIRSPQRNWNKLAKAILVRIWNDIRDESYEAGYAAGIAISGNYKYRLIPLEKTKSESAFIYRLTTSSTGSEILLRNEADQLLLDGRFDESRKKFIAYIDMANKSGNTLNEIKGIIGFAYVNHLENKKPLLTNELSTRFSNLITQVEGKRWQDHFAFISERILPDASNT